MTYELNKTPSRAAPITDTKRVDFFDEYMDALKWKHAVRGAAPRLPTLEIEWFIGDGCPAFKTEGKNFRAVVDAAIQRLA